MMISHKQLKSDMLAGITQELETETAKHIRRAIPSSSKHMRYAQRRMFLRVVANANAAREYEKVLESAVRSAGVIRTQS